MTCVLVWPVVWWCVCAGAKVEMWRACHCSVSHAFVISSIITIQNGYDAMGYAKYYKRNEIVRVLDQVSECVTRSE